MDVDFDFSDVDSFFDEGEWEVEKKMIDVGDEAVKYAEKKADCFCCNHNPSFNDNSNGCVVHGKYICRCGQA